ncbi:ABC transporter substrate-binding protein [Streptomyces sp. NRRL F-5123]|uniref:ABC transporter substrate-binding protein n=1 Tax=Streptomyces sp. NRRL F-5123 TaxID=1463856 RepID=UPI0004E10B7B|nr:ABC transporter substrate-binding protein [Streptomyces sp. NRRL F-5123]
MNVTRAARRRLVAACAVMALGLTSAACSSSGGSSSTADGSTITVTGTTGNLVANFNPFSPSALIPTHGLLYEPLFHYNQAKAGDIQPWLGTSYTWSDGGRTLTIKIRTDAKWNDGKPFTNKDVAYTYELPMKNKDFDQYALGLTGVTTTGSDTVTLKFANSAYTKEYFVLGKVDMIPEHVWAAIPDAQKKKGVNKNPVGTGAWTVKSVAPMSMVLQARTDYYFKGLPRFKTMRFLSFSNNNGSNAATEAGKIDWGGGFIPNIEKNYLAKDPEFDLVNLPLATAMLIPNAKSGPTADVNVRKAISAAIDRDFISKAVYSGQAGPANPMGLLMPNFESVLDPSLKDAAFDTPDKVAGYLTAAGYTKGGDGNWAKNGKKLSIELETVAGWTDYISTGQLLKQQLAKVGIGLTVNAVAYNQFTAHQYGGKFQMIISSQGFTPVPYSYYDQMMDSRIAPKEGTPSTVGNFGEYSSPAVDAALDAIAATPDAAKQQPYFYQLERAFMNDMPVIPLFNAQDEQEFNGNHVTGYPTKDNPYAGAAVWLAMDNGWVAARIAPAASGKK